MNNFIVRRSNLFMCAKQWNQSIPSRTFSKATPQCRLYRIFDEPPRPANYKDNQPVVDWLPFEWKMRPKFNVLRESGKNYIFILNFYFLS